MSLSHHTARPSPIIYHVSPPIIYHISPASYPFLIISYVAMPLNQLYRTYLSQNIWGLSPILFHVGISLSYHIALPSTIIYHVSPHHATHFFLIISHVGMSLPRHIWRVYPIISQITFSSCLMLACLSSCHCRFASFSYWSPPLLLNITHAPIPSTYVWNTMLLSTSSWLIAPIIYYYR